MATVWSELVTRCQAERVVIIAHSYGGVVTQSLASHPGLGAEVRERVTAVLFTDSVHSSGQCSGSGDVPIYSVGHTKHECTSWAAMEMIFADMDKAMEGEGGNKNGNSESEYNKDNDGASNFGDEALKSQQKNHISSEDCRDS